MVCGVVTGNAAPASVASPAVQSISSSFVLVTWSAPEQPNGLVTEYLVERRLILDDGAASDPVNVSAVRVVVPADHYEYLDQSPELRPRTTYEYRIAAQTGAGTTRSPWSSVLTMSASQYSPPLPVFSTHTHTHTHARTHARTHAHTHTLTPV